MHTWSAVAWCTDKWAVGERSRRVENFAIKVEEGVVEKKILDLDRSSLRVDVAARSER